MPYILYSIFHLHLVKAVYLSLQTDTFLVLSTCENEKSINFLQLVIVTIYLIFANLKIKVAI